jgi:hypothetical protein
MQDTDWGSSGLAVNAFADDAVKLTAAQFAAKHGRGFLITHGSSAHPAQGPMRTRAAEKGASEGSAASGEHTTGDIKITIFPVRRRPINMAHNFVSIGRVDGNDIMLADETVSKFHAYIREEAGGFFLQDAKSRNGTTVEGTAVAARGTGAPTKLNTGQTIRVGSVAATFLDVSALLDFVKRLKSYR